MIDGNHPDVHLSDRSVSLAIYDRRDANRIETLPIGRFREGDLGLVVEVDFNWVKVVTSAGHVGWVSDMWLLSVLEPEA